MATDSKHAVWIDPLSYDFSENGPPYLPDFRKSAAAHSEWFAALIAPFKGAPGRELGALVAILRAASNVHQSHHWQTRGSLFYGDHLLFDRLYSESVPFVDQVAERAVGTGSRDVVCPVLQSQLVHGSIRYWCAGATDFSALGLASLSLGVERSVLVCVGAVKSELQANSILTDGIDNLLQGVADKHEEFVYLLQQRVGAESYGYDAR